MNKKIVRPPMEAGATALDTDQPSKQRGFARRSIWPLPFVGEAARRNVYAPDPIPNDGPPRDQSEASPPVRKIGPLHAGGGASFTGIMPELVYLKRIGTLVTRSLARNWLAGAYDARWRVGGVSLPPDFGFGIGHTPAADVIWPNNPQVFMRNPGIRPIAGLPETYRYAPNMPAIQPVGPSIGDVGNITAR